MATVKIDNNKVLVQVSFWEKVGGMQGNFEFPISSITNVVYSTDPINEVRGIRAPGAGFPNRKFGTWRSSGLKDYVNVKRSQAGLVFDLKDQHFNKVIVSIVNANDILKSVREELA